MSADRAPVALPLNPCGNRTRHTAGHYRQPPVSGATPVESPSRRERVDGLAAEGQVPA